MIARSPCGDHSETVIWTSCGHRIIVVRQMKPRHNRSNDAKRIGKFYNPIFLSVLAAGCWVKINRPYFSNESELTICCLSQSILQPKKSTRYHVYDCLTALTSKCHIGDRKHLLSSTHYKQPCAKYEQPPSSNLREVY